MNKKNTLTRDEVQAAYIKWFLDSTTLAELVEIVETDMHQDLSELTDVELVKEVKYFAPELVEGITLSIE